MLTDDSLEVPRPANCSLQGAGPRPRGACKDIVNELTPSRASNGPDEGIRSSIGRLTLIRPTLNDWALGCRPIIKTLMMARVTTATIRAI